MGQSRLSVLRAASTLLLVGAALPAVQLGCDDSDPQGGSTTASGGSAGADSNALGAATSSGANGGTGGTEADGGSGGAGGSSAGTGGSDTQAADSSASGVGGSAGAAGAPPFEGDPRCAGHPQGSVCLGHFITTCEDIDDDGGIDFAQTNCAPGVCAGEDPSCRSGNAGESCADPIVVSATGFVLRGSDFVSDFDGDIDLTDDDTCSLGDAGSSDAVFEVSLEAGQTLSVTQAGKLPAVLAIQRTCGFDEACSASDESSGGFSIEYTAEQAETMFVILDAYQVAPTARDYALHIDIDPACGNGIFEGIEDCDDGNTQAGDGCSPACDVEFPFECTPSSPSLCQEPPTLFSIVPDEVNEYVHEPAFAEDDRLVFIFSVTERVLMDVTAISHTSNTGDINFRLFSDWDTSVIRGTQNGDEDYLAVPFEPGTYFIELFAAEDLPSGFTLTFTSHGIACGDHEVARGFEECDNGDEEGCRDCTLDFGWDCGVASPSECSQVPRIGSAYGAGDPIDDIPVSSAVTPYSSAYWMIEFVDEVELSGTAISPEKPELWTFQTATLESLDQTEHSSYVNPPGTFGPWLVSPGLYVIELFTYTGLPEGYTLRLSTSEP